MSGFGRRVRHERDIWKAVWQQIDTFLDRIDGAADQDESAVTTIIQLLAVVDVIEAARDRQFGCRLKTALPGTPRGAGLTMTAADLTPDEERIPGLEECELAAAPGFLNDDEDLELVMWTSVELATFRDSKRFLEGTRMVPAYDNGTLVGTGPFVNIGDLADKSMFTWDQREDAANGEEAEFKAWSEMRNDRVDDLTENPPPPADSLSSQLAPLGPSSSPASFAPIAAAAQQRASDYDGQRQVLAGARTELSELGADDALTGAIQACENVLAGQVTSYAYVATQLGTATHTQTQIDQVKAQLALAEVIDTTIWAQFTTLDDAVGKGMDDAVRARIEYPDGPLRQLRMLEQGLRHFWRMRSLWMARRSALVTLPLMLNFWVSFINSVNEAVAGRWSQLTLPTGTTTTKVINTRATTVYVNGIPPMDTFRPGRLAQISGDRPAVAVVVDEGFDKNGLFLTTSPMEVSIDVTEGLAGLPGVIAENTAITTTFPTFSDAEWRRGVADDPARTALLTGLVAHVSRLALVLGPGYAGDRFAAPTVPGPYPGLTTFALEGPVAPEAARLFLSAVPSKADSGTGEVLGVARAGELMLIRGTDDDGLVWQGVAEIDSCAVLSGAEAREDDEVTATPVPPCCEDDAEVMVITLRQLQIPSTLTRDITLRRDFLGFGTRSLLAAAILPTGLDNVTSVPSVTVDGESTLVLRDEELKAAVKLFDDWLGRDTGADA